MSTGGAYVEYVANIFLTLKAAITIMIDAGYSYDRLQEKMTGWERTLRIFSIFSLTQIIGIILAQLSRTVTSFSVTHRFILSDVENRHLTGEVRRRVMNGWFKLPKVIIPNKKTLRTTAFEIDAPKSNNSVPAT